ncbi:uncharacterized protein [Argopecten irradians]|uniref:uncharacterized protein isoform X2 n=1 Tax=Argopecten irradians TaxID=31199 RepID=UPI0037182AF5
MGFKTMTLCCFAIVIVRILPGVTSLCFKPSVLTKATPIDQIKVTGTACGHDENCFLEEVTTGDFRDVFNAGCRSVAICNIMAQINAAAGKRSLVIYGQCNSTPLSRPCNSFLCGQQTRPCATVNLHV